MISSWPVAGDVKSDKIELFESLRDAVVKLRNLRSEYNVAPSKPLDIHLVIEDELYFNEMTKQEIYFKKFLNTNVLVIEKELSAKNETILLVGSHIQTYVIKSGIIDTEKEIEQLNKQKQTLEQEINRSKNLLSNENFLKKAPEDKLNIEKEKYQNYLKQYEIVIEKLKAYAK
jgi:valyl-tRNA synthetase